jgi:hypothetical protein
MSQPLDLSQLPDLPTEVVRAFAAQQTALEAARYEASVECAARQRQQTVIAEKETFVTELTALIEALGKVRFRITGARSSRRNPRSWTRRSWNWRWQIWKPPSPRRRHRFGWDMGAALAMANALAIDTRVTAELLPEIEAVMLRKLTEQIASDDGNGCRS